MTDQSEQERGRQLVHREVMACLSSLVSTLANGYGVVSPTGDGSRDLGDLCEQAFELASPIPDYEEAATQEGWRIDGSGVFVLKDEQASEIDPTEACAWENLCDEQGIEPYDREVYEHWAVSDWFGRKLQEAGEKVDFDFANMTVWARTTTGQAIYCDGVVERIVRDLYKPDTIEG